MLAEQKSEAKRVATLGFQEVYAPVRPYLDALDAFLEEQLLAFEPEIREHARYVFGHSGKRLRPLLVVFSGWGTTEPAKNRDLVTLGAVIELVHLATLVHDDILDDASMRHRQQTAAKKFGPSEAVLVGDALFAHALHLAATFPTTEICRAVSQATSRVCAGEIAQTFDRGSANFDLKRYFRVIELKTAELFRISCQLGASVGGHGEAFAKAAGQFGLHLGTAYQIFDDLADLVGDEAAIGKTLGTDIASGKFTLPALLLLKRLPEKERARLLNLADAKDPQLGKLFVTKLAEFPVNEEVCHYFLDEISTAENALKSFEGVPSVEYLLRLSTFVKGQLEKL